MVNKKKTFEQSLGELEEIVQRLESGDVPLEEALAEFKKGIELSQSCQKTLASAETTLTKMMTDDDKEVEFETEEMEK
ncbi:exodeoxyribonuclease VII small subunit [Vagococcus vulneris]|uniref:Exodeoxyribonuclease 7 small subunit n=1 Tax=Vagococcus vulneris TaxID=1977869 RepID=A0A429ZWF8_9ENTE|nr:exodeoxyribonuclease VII small subunit [Vagococcus vulneris]RST98050.1 exodeoxyribonuclease VII small subunit [Vagococcus vulneris]